MTLGREATLEMHTSLLTGSEGYVQLLHPEQLVCYREFGSNKPKVACHRHLTTALKFDTEEPELLYCKLSCHMTRLVTNKCLYILFLSFNFPAGANSDSSVTVWDIGVPSGADYSTEIK